MVGLLKNSWRLISRISVPMHVSEGIWGRTPTRSRSRSRSRSRAAMMMMMMRRRRRRMMQGMMMMRMRRRRRRRMQWSRRREMDGIEVMGGVMMMIFWRNSSILENAVWFFWYDFNHILASLMWLFFNPILTVFYEFNMIFTGILYSFKWWIWRYKYFIL